MVKRLDIDFLACFKPPLCVDPLCGSDARGRVSCRGHGEECVHLGQLTEKFVEFHIHEQSTGGGHIRQAGSMHGCLRPLDCQFLGKSL